MQSPVYPDIEMRKKVLSRNGVDIEIEYCPKSGGVWLDRGELEKIIRAVEDEKSAYFEEDMAPDIGGSTSPRAPMYSNQQQNKQYRDHDDDDYKYDQNGRPVKKRESILGEIFDIF